MPEIRFNVSNNIALALGETPEELVRDVKLFTAIQFFQQERLSLKQAAELAGVDDYKFMIHLTKYQIPTRGQSALDLTNPVEKFQW